MGHALRYRRSEAAAAIRRSLPALTNSEIHSVLHDMYQNIGLSLAESLWLTPDRLPSYIDQHVTLHGRDLIRELRTRSRGVLVLTAHAGNFDLLCRSAPTLGFPLTIIAKRLRNPSWDAEVRRRWATFGVEVLPPKGAFRGCVRALRSGRLVGFMLDQNMTRDEGVFVEFFGRPACTTPGLAQLSAHTGAWVLPVFIERVQDRRHEIQVGVPIPPPSRHEQAIVEATQTYTRVIEDWIRAHPSQWIWIHRRWKTQPKPAECSTGRTGP